MDLIDRFGRAPLAMGAFQVVVFVVVLAYGLWPPSLGTHVVLPGLVAAAVFGALVAITLFVPWDPTFFRDEEGLRSWWRWGLSASGVLSEITLGIGTLCVYTLADAKDTMRRLGEGDLLAQALRMDEARAWAADTWGTSIVSGPGLLGLVVGPAALLLLLWILLPR